MAGLTWLHLSDWHQEGKDFDRRVVCDALIKDIKNRAEIHRDLENVDFVVFSGDLAFHGKKEEFETAREHLLDPVLKATGLTNDRLFIVPGNHDLDRARFRLLPADLRKPLKETRKINEWLTDDEGREEILKPFKDYKNFVNEYTGSKLSGYADCYQLEVGGKRIVLFGFNSALMCGHPRCEESKISTDERNLIIGEPQIYDLLKDRSDADLRIAVMHHPLDWLTENDCISVERRLKEAAHFILYGHQHRGKVEVIKGTNGDCVVIPAGAGYSGRIATDSRYVNAYNFVHLDFETNKGTVYLRCWNESGYKWQEDGYTYSKGEFPFHLPKTDAKENIESIPSPIIEPVSHPSSSFSLDNPVFNVPFRAKNEGMVGREDALKKVRDQLVQGKPTAIGHTAAFQGIGGLGKTQLAVEYAYRFRDAYPKGIIWINADQDIDAQLIQIAKQANWISSESKHADILEVSKRRLKHGSDCLIIFDNVEKYQDIEAYLPHVNAIPHLLITSRSPQKGFTPIDINLLDEALSLELLLKESGRNIDDLQESEKESAREIAISLGGLPLAIEIAGAYLNHLRVCTFRNYLTILKDNLNAALNGDWLSSFTDHEQNLFVTLEISKDVLKTAPELDEIIDVLAWSGNSFMGISLLTAVLDKKEAELIPALNIGLSLRILQKDRDAERYDIHRLIRQVRQEQFPIKDRIEWIKAVCQQLGDWFEQRRQEFSALPAFEAEIDHLKQWLTHIMPHSSLHAARLTWLQAYPPYHWGKYQESNQMVQSAFNLLEKTETQDLALKANILNDLGATLNSLGKINSGLEYDKQALEIRLKLFGEQHADTAMSLNNIGGVLDDLGQYDEALKYYQRALKIRREIFGEQHPDTAKALNNIGAVYDALGKYEEALKYCERALKILREIFGEQHPDTATTLNNIGFVYDDLGEHEEALKYYERALKIQQEIFGEHHKDTAVTLNNIGGVFEGLGQYEEALKYYKHALEIRREILGEKYPDITVSLRRIGRVYWGMKKYKDALDYLERSLKIDCEIIGELHPDSVTTGLNIIDTLAKLKKFPEVSSRLNHYKDILPPDHPKYKYLAEIEKLINTEKRKSMSAFSGKKRRK
ncbi:MAG: tetratricopeptide repeat protein [Candidatus Omnitrophota bacterium]